MLSQTRRLLTKNKSLYYLLLRLTYRDIAARYKGSKAGLLWTLLTPIILLLVYSFVFGYVFQARWQGTVNDSKAFFALNLFAGMLVHGALAETLTRSCNIFSAHSNYVKKIIFPLWTLPVATVLSSAFQAAINLLVLLIGLMTLQATFHWQAILLPLLILPFIVTLIGISLLIASVGVYLKDLQQILPLITTVLLFISPVFYPVSALPESFQILMHANPLTSVIEMLRATVLHGQLPTLPNFIISILYGATTCCLGLFIYNRLKVGFADVL